MKQKIILLCVLILGIISFIILKPNPKVIKENGNENSNNNLISVLVDGVEQSAFPSKGSAEYQSTSCTNGEHAEWDEANWKLSIQDISASTRCVVSFVTGGHNVYVTVSGGTVDNAPKNVPHNGNVTFNVASSNSNYVFSSVKCSGANSYTWANNILSVNGVTADAYCDVVFSRPTYTVYFNVVGGYTSDNYLTVVRGGGNSTTFGAVPGYLTGGSKIECDPGINGKITGTRIVLSEVQSSGDCTITCARDTSSYLPGSGTYNPGQEVSYANLAWQVVTSDEKTVTLILKSNAVYEKNEKGTGDFGSGVTFSSSTARNYLQDIWLQQDAQKYLRNAIDSEGLAYQEDANGYIRLPYVKEVNKELPNASNTSFWTMDNDGQGHVYYGQPDGYLTEGKASDGKYYYEYYTLATNTSAVYKDAPGNISSSKYYSTTCNSRSNDKCDSNTTSYPGHNDDLGTYCDSSVGPKSVMICKVNASSVGYVSCAGLIPYDYNSKTFSPATNCPNTCSQSLPGTWTQVTLNNIYSGNSYNNGSYGIGYRKWIRNIAGEGVATQPGTLTTEVTYSDGTTNGNSGMTTGVQAVSPSSNSARTNDTTPSATSAASDVPNNSATINGPYYSGWSATATSCDDIKTNSINVFTNGKATYTRYTIRQNIIPIGYRPVIVVYKAN